MKPSCPRASAVTHIEHATATAARSCKVRSARCSGWWNAGQDSIRDQQPYFHSEANALFADQRRAVGLDGVVFVSAGVTHGHDAFHPHVALAAGGGRMLLIRHLALHLAVGAAIGAVAKIKRIAAT